MVPPPYNNVWRRGMHVYALHTAHYACFTQCTMYCRVPYTTHVSRCVQCTATSWRCWHVIKLPWHIWVSLDIGSCVGPCQCFTVYKHMKSQDLHNLARVSGQGLRGRLFIFSILERIFEHPFTHFTSNLYWGKENASENQVCWIAREDNEPDRHIWRWVRGQASSQGEVVCCGDVWNKLERRSEVTVELRQSRKCWKLRVEYLGNETRNLSTAVIVHATD